MMQAAWMRGLGLLLAAVCAAPPARAQVVEYYHLDALGSVRAVSNQAGVVVENHDYLPYGEEWCGSGVCTGVSAGQPRRFTGKERDAETGLDYFGARYYGAKLGRFTTIDPVYTWQENLVDPQRWNRYAYVRGNPLRYVDPDGRAPAVAGVAAVVVELGLTAYDVYDAYSTVTDPEASTTAKVVSTAGLAAGVFLPGGGYGAAGKKAASFGAKHADDAARFLADTDIVIRHGKDLLKEGLDVVKSFATDIELTRLVREGRLRGVPGAAKHLPSVGPPQIHTRINVRGGLTPTKRSAKRRGNFVDGIVGASAIENKRTLLTVDKELADAVTNAGGSAIRMQ